MEKLVFLALNHRESLLEIAGSSDDKHGVLNKLTAENDLLCF